MNWIKKYKLYHIPFWALYHYAWWSFYSGDPVETATALISSASSFKYLFYVVFQAIGVYFCLYYLIPKFLKSGKYSLFLGSTFLTIIIVATCTLGGYYVNAHLVGADVYELYNMSPRSPFSFFKFNSLPSTISAFTLAISIKMAKSWIETNQRSQQLEKEKLETELKFLRSQFNPHFLFNTINSVFFLIDNNPVMASETLAKFSNLLRYQLYECNATSIPLNREIEYLESFVELEEIRLNKNFDINIDFPKQNNGDLMISPFILMPFVENAFKHVSHHHDKTNWIKIEISVSAKLLTFKVSNSTSDVFKSVKSPEEYSGIGLQNVTRRLELLYPQKYQLTIEELPKSYSTKLQLELSLSTVPAPKATQTIPV